MAEGAAAGDFVGNFSTSVDPDSGQTFIYTLVVGDGDADNGKFMIAGNELKLASAAPDYAVQPALYIRVRSTDSGVPAQYVEKQFVIKVLDHSLLSIADNFVVQHNATIGIPVVFTANGNAPTDAAFGISYNPTCLTYVSISGGTGTAACRRGDRQQPRAFQQRHAGDAQLHGQPRLPLGHECAAGLHDRHQPHRCHGALPVSTDNGQVLVIANSARGDCNSDGFVNAGDFSAIVLETFDADLPWWLNAPQSTFHGSPVGCDANSSEYIDVADVVCTVLVVFGNSSCTGGSLAAAAAVEPATLAVVPTVNDSGIEVPVTLDRKGSAVAAAAFTLTYDPQQAAFDSSDATATASPTP